MTYGSPGPLQIEDVTFNFLTGELADAPIYAAFHKNRFWISGATGTSTTNNVALVKSRYPSNALVKFDLKVNDFAHFNDNFYASASTHSAIYRMDFGTNDNGDAIDWYWTSKEFDFGNPYTKKNLKEIIIDHRSSDAANMKVGYKRDGDSSFTEATANLSSTGRETSRLFINGGLSHGFRFRVRDSALDESGRILGMHGYAFPGRTRE